MILNCVTDMGDGNVGDGLNIAGQHSMDSMKSKFRRYISDFSAATVG